jgi:hypothetical protein
MKNQNNQNFLKSPFYYILIFISFIFFTIGCGNNDESNLPTTSEFNNLKTVALNSLTQNFQFNAEAGNVSFSSAKGVTININGSSLTLNGNPVTGLIDLKYIEIFDGGNMLVTSMHTMGIMADGNQSMLISGGEFYINATKNGQQLQLNGSVTLTIPTNLTDDNGGNPDMKLWDFVDNLVWVQQGQEQVNNGQGVFLEGQATGANVYYAFVDDFGWTNVDIFYSNPNPKTTILVSVPDGYDNQNCAIYLHYDGQGSALAKLDIYNTTNHLFSEHYGQIPIGLACNIIFVSESDGQWRYAIKPVTISADAVYNFTLAETTVGSQAELTAAINALP